MKLAQVTKIEWLDVDNRFNWTIEEKKKFILQYCPQTKLEKTIKSLEMFKLEKLLEISVSAFEFQGDALNSNLL